MADVDDMGYYTELIDAYTQAASSCEIRAGDFKNGSPGYLAHMKAAKNIMGLAKKTADRGEEFYITAGRPRLYFFHGMAWVYGAQEHVTIVAKNVADCGRVFMGYNMEGEAKSRFRTHWSKMPFDAERGIPYRRGAYVQSSNTTRTYKEAPREQPQSKEG